MRESDGSRRPRLGVKGKKVKTACQTCKTRKIKCDEERPACRRCVSTGRTCPGYGIWDVKGGRHQPCAPTLVRDSNRRSSLAKAYALPAKTVQICRVDSEDYYYLDWFKCRTAVKLPGIFESGYWKTLIYQASVKEPAVRHAVIALSAAHKSETFFGDCLGSEDICPSEQEKLMLLHYNMAISSLTHEIGKHHDALDSVTLMVCILFVCLEQVRGHYQTAQKHLYAGVALVEKSRHHLQSLADTSAPDTMYRPQSIDDDVTEVLQSLQSRAVLVFPAHEATLQTGSDLLIILSIDSMRQAKRFLDELLIRSFAMTERSCHFRKSQCPDLRRALQHRQRRLIVELSSWMRAYTAFRTAARSPLSVVDGVQNWLLNSHHAMASSMAAACLDNPGEGDSNPGFLRILANSIPLAQLRRQPNFDALHKQRYGTIPEKATHGIDMGWIPPLYYTAIKCQTLRIRLHAIRLLERSEHREGPWASPIAVAVAKEVIELEYGRSYYNICKKLADFSWESMPTEVDCMMSPVIEKHRIIEDVRIILPDDAMGKVVIRCEFQTRSGEWEVIGRAYDVLTGSWSDDSHAAS